MPQNYGKRTWPGLGQFPIEASAQERPGNARLQWGTRPPARAAADKNPVGAAGLLSRASGAGAILVLTPFADRPPPAAVHLNTPATSAADRCANGVRTKIAPAPEARDNNPAAPTGFLSAAARAGGRVPYCSLAFPGRS